MKNIFTQHKEIVFLIGAAFVVGLAVHDLFSEQQQNSGLINSGTTLRPSNFSGRVSCEVPIPNVQSRMGPEEAEHFKKKSHVRNSQEKSGSERN